MKKMNANANKVIYELAVKENLVLLAIPIANLVLNQEVAIVAKQYMQLLLQVLILIVNVNKKIQDMNKV